MTNVEIRIGGTTSIDFNMAGVDKGVAVKRFMDKMSLRRQDVLFIGDCLFKGGNDYPIVKLRVRRTPVKNPEEAYKKLSAWL